MESCSYVILYVIVSLGMESQAAFRDGLPRPFIPPAKVYSVPELLSGCCRDVYINHSSRSG